MLVTELVLVTMAAYLIGSIPFGYLIARRKAKIDITSFGSGRIGATNVLRTLGRKMAALVALLDVLKGVAAVLLAGAVIGHDYVLVGDYHLGILAAQVAAALAAVAGHIFPVFNHFKGGRGVATFFGGFIALYPLAAVFGGEVFIISVGLTGFASLGSIAGVAGAYAMMIPLSLHSGIPMEYLVYSLIGSTVVIFMHRDNIQRLIAGKERRINEKAH
ncbi:MULTISPECIES: glycerol-3-phosphate 1-O-acyltransferase PlsY [Dehalogenimonas]|jgi:acyl phosphate:glycerol-3-phosphate acyltransferase|uniref:Glycerol-3-phosphate acyltransferase n=2 Tax=Dehalogenimonas TaxID=670486 RepID=A0A0W0GHD9_9CHLR|nr:glycerol-3-phosphate 1-O-acyltransferase PlsY [Dehalogenimonas alkenigignens]KTB47975.1 acyl-phosphate glycerol-3-phosphate acyltransferase [Dehalogenimonas alkenigignens]PVV83238.1 glycerol-3-phosphate acyltransferase [Dehalogenimonas alkenigignens]